MLTANRIAAIATFLSALGALIASFVGVFPQGWQNAAVAIIAIIAKLGIASKFLTGAQQWDRLTHGPVSPPVVTPPAANTSNT